MMAEFDGQVLFMIPNDLDHGAQNFFRRLAKSFKVKNKLLFIESNEGNFIARINKIFQLSKNKKLFIFSTVNSNKFALLIKILIPSITIIPRLGNTISLELKKYSVEYYAHKLFYFCLLCLSRKFIFQSQVMEQDFKNFFNFKNNKKFIILHNGIEHSTIEHGKASKLIASNKKIFLLVGTFKFQKGYEIFFNSLEHVSNEIMTNSEFHICGDGDELYSWARFMETHKYKKHVIFHGMVNPTKFYQSSHAYILPSRFEGFSNSLIEALSFGLPCLVSDCPSANREVIAEYQNGIFFKNLDSKDLAKKIGEIYHNLHKFDNKLIIKNLYDRFSIDKISDKYMKLIM